MYYRLSENVGLRKWKFVDRCYYVKDYVFALPIPQDEWEIALLCDGEHDLPESEPLKHLLVKGIVEECEKGRRPSDWSRLHIFENRYFPKMNLMITGKCNYNCRHCFNAKDNAPLNSEWAFEDLVKLLDQCVETGVHAFTITGGEPMVHPRFLDILREIYKRDMFVFELNTNGFFITDAILDAMEEIGCRPLIKISFDGIGHHDWMRQHKGAEENAFKAISLCKKHGFRVMIQTQVHLHNLDSILPTCIKMADLGCDETRIIRTTEVVRWMENGEGSSLPMERYYDEMIRLAAEYMPLGKKMVVDIWQLLTLYPQSKSFSLSTVLGGCSNFKVNFPRCRGNRGMIAVSSSGEVVPCLQMSGYFEEFDIRLGNIKKSSLKDVIESETYFEAVGGSILDYALRNETCASCPYFRVCAGGCPALGLLTSGESHDYYHEDISKCLFFKGGYYDKAVSALGEYNLLNKIAYSEEKGLYEILKEE